MKAIICRYLFVSKLLSERCHSCFKLLMSSFYPTELLFSLCSIALPLTLKHHYMLVLVTYCCLQMGDGAGRTSVLSFNGRKLSFNG